METYTWTTIRDEAVEHFNGDTPGSQLEQDIIGHFVNDPERVIRTINRIADQHKRNPLRSPWAVLRADLNRTTQTDITADNTRSRSRAIDQAKQWIRNAGCHYDLEKHVEADLFGDDLARGRLHDYANDQPMRDELLDYWRQQRPRGEQAEADHDQYMRDCVATRERITKLKQDTITEAKRQLEEQASPREGQCETTPSTNESATSDAAPTRAHSSTSTSTPPRCTGR